MKTRLQTTSHCAQYFFSFFLLFLPKPAISWSKRNLSSSLSTQTIILLCTWETLHHCQLNKNMCRLCDAILHVWYKLTGAHH